jgi:hypothetical protein
VRGPAGILKRDYSVPFAGARSEVEKEEVPGRQRQAR